MKIKSRKLLNVFAAAMLLVSLVSAFSIPAVAQEPPPCDPECTATAPDFTICQYTQLTDELFIDNGVECSSGDCELIICYDDVCPERPGCYEYTVRCKPDCPECNEACTGVATGTVCVTPCFEVEIIECPEGVIAPSTNFVVKAEIENCSGDIQRNVVATIEIVKGSVDILDPAEWPLGNMDVEDETTVAWNLHCAGSGPVEIKVSVNECGYDTCKFEQQKPAELCAEVEAPCEICTLCPDPQGQFTVNACVKNIGDVAVHTVQAQIVVGSTCGGTAQVIGPLIKTVDVGGDGLLTAGESACVSWDLLCTSEGDVCFTVLFTALDQCTPSRQVTASDDALTRQRKVLVDILCVKGLETDYDPACDTDCLVHFDNDEDGCCDVCGDDYAIGAMYDIVSTEQPFSVKTSIRNCTDVIQTITAKIIVPAGTRLKPGTQVKIYCPATQQTTYAPVSDVITLPPVCPCCDVEVTWILECTGSSQGEELPIEVQATMNAVTYSSMPCNPAYVIQELKTHLSATMEAFVEDCDSECPVPVTAVAMCQDYDIKVCITNEGEADATNVGLNITLSGPTTCAGEYTSVMLAGKYDIDGKLSNGVIKGGETVCFWLSDLIGCDLICEDVGPVTAIITSMFGQDENTCEPIKAANIEEVCPLVIKQCNIFATILNPDMEEGENTYYTGQPFAIKARIYNCGPCNFENVSVKLCWTGPGEVQLLDGSLKTQVIPLIPAPDRDCVPECTPTIYEVSWMVQCTKPGDVEFYACIESENPVLNIRTLGWEDIEAEESPILCCTSCEERPELPPAIVHQIPRDFALAKVEIISPDRGAKYATSQEFAVTAVIKNLEPHATITINEATLVDYGVGGSKIETVGAPMPALPWVIPAGESKTVTWTVHCTESGLGWFMAEIKGISEIGQKAYMLSMPVEVWLYAAAHLVVDIVDYPVDPIVTSTQFPVTATITNTGEADATEVYATLSVNPDGSVRVCAGDSGYTKYIGTIPGHGSEANSVTVTWCLHCKVPCESTITVDVSGADEYGWHMKQECASTGNFIIASGCEYIEALDEFAEWENRGWFRGYYVGDANGLTGPFLVDTPISWAAEGGGPDFTGRMVGMGAVITGMSPAMTYWLSQVCCDCSFISDIIDLAVGKDLMVFVGHIVTDTSGDILPPPSNWCVAPGPVPGVIEVINGKIGGTYLIEESEENDLSGIWIKSLLGGTYCSNMAAEPGLAIQERFIEPDSVTVKQLPMTADLSIFKSSCACEVTMGDTTAFTVTVSNLGPSTANGILVSDVLPATLNYISSSASQGWYDVTSGIWDVGTLSSGSQAVMNIVVTVNTVGDACNRATIIASDVNDPITTNNSSQACVTAVAPASVNAVCCPLVVGYNLYSPPIIPTDPDIEDILDALLDAGKVIKVSAYFNDGDPTVDDWFVYNPGPAPDNLTEIVDGQGYWINMNAAGDLCFDGEQYVASPLDLPPSYGVLPGWNLIGFKSTVAKSPVEYLAGIAGKYVMIYGYDGGSYYIVGSPGHEMMQPCHGYWIAVTQPGTIYP